VNSILVLRALAAPESAALPRHCCCTAEAIAVVHAVYSNPGAANSHTVDKAVEVRESWLMLGLSGQQKEVRQST
jgi:hypothetical protein